MNKGITAEQVIKALGPDCDKALMVREVFVGDMANVPWKTGKYIIYFHGDAEVSMHEILSLAALFGGTGITAKYNAENLVDYPFTIEVTDT